MKENEPVKYHFTMFSYLCTQKNQSRYGEVVSDNKIN